MGALAQILGKKGCDLVTGTDPFAAPAGKQIFMFKTNEETEIDEFDEIPVSIVNNAWTEGSADDAETIDDRSYCGETLMAGMEIYFDGPVTSITLASGSGIVYYL